jgi:hypothetical protein
MKLTVLPNLIILLIITCFSVTTFPQNYADTVYVNPNGRNPDGRSWATGWNDFTQFDINQYPSSVLLLIGPGTYTKGHVNYYYDSSRAILMIYNKSDVKIAWYHPYPKERDPVIFYPEDTVKYGIWLQPNRTLATVKKITINQIDFYEYRNIALGISGLVILIELKPY